MSHIRLALRSNPDAEIVAAFKGKIKKGEVVVARGAYRAMRGGVPVDDSDGGMRSHLNYVSQGCGVSFQKASVVWSRDVAPRLIRK